MSDVLFAELMKQAKKVWEIHREYYGETDKEIVIDADNNVAVEAAEASLDELWLPVSAVKEWLERKEAEFEKKVGKYCKMSKHHRWEMGKPIPCVDCRSMIYGFKKVLGVKP